MAQGQKVECGMWVSHGGDVKREVWFWGEVSSESPSLRGARSSDLGFLYGLFPGVNLQDPLQPSSLAHSFHCLDGQFYLI